MVTAVRRFVAEGGSLMLGVRRWHAIVDGSLRICPVAIFRSGGVKYALYESLRDKTTQWSEIKGTAQTFDEIRSTAGKVLSVLFRQQAG